MLIALTTIHFLLWQFVFGFQRITLKISRQIASGVGLSINDCQIALTPGWVGLLGWVNRFLSVIVVATVFSVHGLGWSIIFFLLIYMGGYATVSFSFNPFVEKISQHLIQQGLNGLKKTGHGYLTAWNIEKTLSFERKNEQETTK